jgi:hypothetical protein
MLSKIIAKSSITAIFATLALTVAVTIVTPSVLAQVEITEGEFAVQENFTAPENVTAPENMTEIGNLTGDDAGLPPIPEGLAP